MTLRTYVQALIDLQVPTMKSSSLAVACLLAALLVAGALAEPRKLLEAGADLSEANEHQRILAELEEVHQLRERMLQQGKST